MKTLLTALLMLFAQSARAADEPARDSLQSISQDAIDLQNDLAAILETAKTKEDLERVRDKIEKIRLATERLKTRTEKLLSDPDPQKLLAKLAVASDKTARDAARAEERYQAAMRKLDVDTRQLFQSRLTSGIPSSHEALIDEYAKMVNELNDVLGKVKTKEDVQQRRGDLERIARRAKELEVHAKKLGEPKPEVAEKVMTKAMKMMENAMKMQEKLQKLPPDVQAELNKFDLKLR